MSRTNAGVVTGTGRVISYDAHVGLGELRDDDGLIWAFHCTAIVDGSRSIEVDRQVVFQVAPAGPGKWEARHVQPF